MTTINLATNETLLRRALQGNGLFSTLSALVLTFGAGVIAEFMGVQSAVPFVVIGIGLAVFAFGLFRDAMRQPLNLRKAWLTVALDVEWVAVSALILLTDAFALSTGGRWAVLAVADVVTLFAIVQYIGIRRARR